MRSKRQLSIKEATGKAQYLCSKSEQCSSDIYKKLIDWGIIKDEAETIIGNLVADRYLDDSRFCKAYCKDKSRFDGWGRIKIRYFLKQKQIPSEIIEDGLGEINEDEYQKQLVSILNVKRRSMHGKDFQSAKASLFRFAASRGYEPDLIFPILNNILKNEEDSE